MKAPYPQLSPDSLPLVQRLYQRSRSFFELISGKEAAPNAAERLFVGRPAELSIEQKHVLGVFEDDTLVGVFDILMGYPNPDVGFIGLFLLDPDYRRRGLGSDAYRAVEQWFKSLGLCEVQLGVQLNNKAGRLFWESHGFVYLKDVPLRDDDDLNGNVLLFSKALQA